MRCQCVLQLSMAMAGAGQETWRLGKRRKTKIDAELTLDVFCKDLPQQISTMWSVLAAAGYATIMPDEQQQQEMVAYMRGCIRIKGKGLASKQDESIRFEPSNDKAREVTKGHGELLVVAELRMTTSDLVAAAAVIGGLAWLKGTFRSEPLSSFHCAMLRLAGGKKEKVGSILQHDTFVQSHECGEVLDVLAAVNRELCLLGDKTLSSGASA